MKSKTFLIPVIVLLAVAVTYFTGCERAQEVLTPPDAATPSTLKVGLIQPTGHYTGFAKGAELAQAEINAAGGVLGMQIEFVRRDNLVPGEDYPNADLTLQYAKELVEDEGVVALVGPIYSTISAQLGPVVQVPILPPSTGSTVTATSPEGFIFLVGTVSSLQSQVLAKLATEDLAATTAATIHQDGDLYSESLTDAFVTAFEGLGGTITASEIYQVGDTAFAEQLAQIGSPDVLLLSSYGPEVPILMKEARELGIQATFIGGDGWDDPEKFLKALTDNAPLEGSYYITGLSPQDPGALQFIQAYQTKFGTLADGIAASGYDAVRVLALAIATAQSTEAGAIREALAATTDYSGASAISGFDEKNHAVKSLGVLQIVDGQPQPYKVVAP